MTTWEAHVESIRANTHPSVLIAAAAASKRIAAEAAAKRALVRLPADGPADARTPNRAAVTAVATPHQAVRPNTPVLMNVAPTGANAVTSGANAVTVGARSRSHQVLRSSTMTGHTQPSQLSFEFSRV
jgi:hypothetical protein